MNRSIQTFKKLLAINGSILFVMSLQRLVLFLVIVRHWLFGADGFTIASSFFAGLRFDLCVLGFLNIPVLFLTWGISTNYVANHLNPVIKMFRRWVLWVYLAVATLWIHALALVDMMYFATNGERWTFSAWQESGTEFIQKATQMWGPVFTAGVVLLFVLFWVFRCLFYMYRVRLHDISAVPTKFDNSRSTMYLLGIALPVLVVATAARGTWTMHHINIEHARVSQNEVLNQLALSPIWAFDKKF